MDKNKAPVSKIKSMAIENFRAFKTRQEFPVRPINLIFGPNSAGKSALIKGLAYSLEEGNPKQLDLSGVNRYAENGEYAGAYCQFSYELDTKSFQQIINRNHLSESLKENLFAVPVNESFTFIHYIDTFNAPGNHGHCVSHGDFKVFNENWNYGKGKKKDYLDIPFWNYLKISIDEIFSSSPDLMNISGLDSNGYFRIIQEIIQNILDDVYPEHGHEMDYVVLNGDAMNRIMDSPLFSIIERSYSDENGEFFDNGFEDFSDDFNEACRHVEDGRISNNFKYDLITDSALRLLEVQDLKNRMFCINTMQLIFSAGYDIIELYRPLFEFHVKNDNKLLYLGVERESVDFSLSSIDLVKSPLNAYLRDAKCINGINAWFENALIPFELIEPEPLVGKNSGRSYLRSYDLPIDIMDKRVDTVLPLKDVGYGLKKLIPVLAAVHYELWEYGKHAELGKYDLVAIEEPEIHLHPKLQSELGDLFVNDVVNGSRKTYFIETHSENMLQRMLRRVREGVIAADAINVLYVHPGVGNDGARVERLEIDDEGEFMTPWPKGFFDTREDDILA